MASSPKRTYRTFGGIVGNTDLKTLSTGKDILTFGVGYTTDPSSNELSWINCKAWEETAKRLVNLLEKGDKIVVNGPVDEYQGRWSLTVYDYAVIKRRQAGSQQSGIKHNSGPDDGIPF